MPHFIDTNYEIIIIKKSKSQTTEYDNEDLKIYVLWQYLDVLHVSRSESYSVLSPFMSKLR